MMLKTTLVLVTTLAAAACGSPVAYETEPVVRNTVAGPITCQLYDRGIVWLDRATDRPKSMSSAEADDFCRQVGRTLQE